MMDWCGVRKPGRSWGLFEQTHQQGDGAESKANYFPLHLSQLNLMEGSTYPNSTHTPLLAYLTTIHVIVAAVHDNN